MGCLNVRGCGKNEKKCQIVDMFKERKLDVLALSETKVKGKGEHTWEGQRVIVSGVDERCRAREGVGIMLAGRLWGKVKEYVCVSSRIVWVRLNIRGSKVVIVSVYGPGMERSETERMQFWEGLNECLAGFDESERVIVMGDLNAKVGDRERGDVVGRFGVPGMNENGECLLELCEERRLSVGNTWFEKKRIHKYTWQRENGEDKSLLDVILIQSKWKKSLIDVMVRRGVAGGLSDHFLVESKMKIAGPRHREYTRAGTIREVKYQELEKLEVREAYRQRIDVEWELVRHRELMGVEEEFGMFRSGVVGSAAAECGYRKLGRKSKNSEWWDEEVRGLVKEKRKLYEVQLQTRDERDVDRYKRQNGVVKRKVKEKKEVADGRFGERLSKNFKDNKKMFWKDVNMEMKKDDQMDTKIKDADGNILSEENAVRNRWKEYFEELLNVDDGREVEMNEVQLNGANRNARMVMELNEDDVRKAVKKLKKGKSPGIDGITSEMLKYGGESIIEWLTRVCMVCLVKGEVPLDWRRAIVVPFYKGKGDRKECKNYRGISLLSIPGKVYGRVLIDRVRYETENMVGEEQCGFRNGRGCIDQVYVLRQLAERFESKGKDMYVAYMDLEKAYDRIDRSAMWRVLVMYGINGNLLRAIKSFYDGSEACVRVCRQKSDWFSVKVGLRQGCVMSPWLFNLFMDGVMREVRARVGEVGVNLWDNVRRCKWKVEWLMFADDTVLVGDSKEKLQELVNEFGNVCERRKLTVNVNKSKAMRISGKENEFDVNVDMNGENLEAVEAYKYLGVNVTCDGKLKEEINHRIIEARKAAGALQGIWKKRALSTEAKVGMYEAIVEPSLLYGSEVWVLNVHERKRVQAVEMNCMRNICGVRRIERVRNEEIRRRCGKNVGVCEKVEQNVLRWFGHVERMGDERLVKRMHDSDIMGRRRRGRPRKSWMDEVSESLGKRGLSIQVAKECVQDRNGWRSICRGVRRAAGGAPA